MNNEFSKIEKKIEKLYRSLDRLLYKIIYEYLTDNISVSDNVIKNTTSNIGVINAIQNELSKKSASFLKKIREAIIEGIKSLIYKSASQMSEYNPVAIAKGKAIAEVLAKQAVNTINANIDIQKAFMDVKSNIISLMANPNGASLKVIRKNLEYKIVEKGITTTQFKSWTLNVFMQYQRAGSNEIRKELKLTNAIYQGGLMENSREFCIERDGKVFTDSEIESWQNVDFPEKWDPYNPFTDCGCYNCRHRLDWISQELAEKLRPELAEK